MFWLFFTLYMLVALFVARKIFAYIRRNDEDMFDDAVDTTMFGFVSLFAAMFWPIAGPIALVVAKPNKGQAAKIAERDKRIAELEKELKIGSYSERSYGRGLY